MRASVHYQNAKVLTFVIRRTAQGHNQTVVTNNMPPSGAVMAQGKHHSTVVVAKQCQITP
jgi:hypothetical protein